MQNIKNFLFFILGASSVIIIIILTSYTEPYKSINSKLFNYANNDSSHYYVSDTFSLPVQKVHAPNIPDVIDFAGEKLPIDNFDAKERFDRELISNCFRHSATFLFFKKANRYFPLIEPILKEYGIPDDVKYLAVAESALSNAVSPAGAKGFWQFMPAAARERGLEVNSEVDERYNLKKSTVAACKYLKDAYNIFGSWTLAAASYNMGKAGLQKRIQQQKGKSYFDLHLNTETSRYILRIMAIKEIMENPIKYGFHFSNDDLYSDVPQFKIITETGSIPDLSEYAQKHKVSYRMLKIYNPWLRHLSLTNKNKKTYQIKIPI